MTDQERQAAWDRVAAEMQAHESGLHATNTSAVIGMAIIAAANLALFVLHVLAA